MNLYEAKWTDTSRSEHKKNGGYFAGKNETFPLKDASDVDDAYRLAGHAENPDQVRKNIINWAKDNGHADALPDTAKDDKTQESVDIFESKDRIARIKSYFIEDNAKSLNGRKYPKEATDKLINSIHRRLAESDPLPMTCYLSHDHADGGNAQHLVGKVSGAGREGAKGFVWLDIPDTQAGRETLTLARGGYIKSQSLRASGARMYTSRESDVPLVGGDLQFEGIDWTTTPGLRQVARIADIVTESAEPQTLNEVFHVDILLVEEQKEIVSMDPKEKLKEDGLQPLTSGVTTGVADGPTQDEYSKRTMSIAPTAVPTDAPSNLNDVHNHIASAMGMDCVPSTMERDASLKFLGITEAGAKFSQKTAKHLAAAHDGVAAHLQKDCAGKGSAAAINNMDDGADNKQEQKQFTQQELDTFIKERLEAQRILHEIRALPKPVQTQKEETKPMTPEEAARLLQEAGYTIQAPKSEEEKLQEAFDAKLAEKLNAMQAAFDAKIAEVTQKTAHLNRFSVTPPQRKSMVEGSNTQETTPKRTYYRNGDYLREQLSDITFREQLLDRSRPLPDNFNPEHALNELKKELLGMYDAIYGLTGNPTVFRNNSY